MQAYITPLGLTFYIETYGCQMNSHDSEKIAGILSGMGFAPAQQKEKADLVLFNTCCVRENAENKLFGNVGKLKQWKQQSSRRMIGVCGCMMQQPGAAERLADMFPFVDLIFGTTNMQFLPQMLHEVLVERHRSLHIDPDGGGDDGGDEIIVIGVDCTDTAVEYINAGKLYGTVKQDGDAMGKANILMAINGALGKDWLDGTDYTMADDGFSIRIPYAKITAE